MVRWTMSLSLFMRKRLTKPFMETVMSVCMTIQACRWQKCTKWRHQWTAKLLLRSSYKEMCRTLNPFSRRMVLLIISYTQTKWWPRLSWVLVMPKWTTLWCRRIHMIRLSNSRCLCSRWIQTSTILPITMLPSNSSKCRQQVWASRLCSSPVAISWARVNNSQQAWWSLLQRLLWVQWGSPEPTSWAQVPRHNSPFNRCSHRYSSSRQHT